MIEKTIVLITGANSGVGFASALTIAAHSPSYHVIIGSRSLSRGQGAVQELQAKDLPGTVSTVQLDVRDIASVSAAVKAVEDEFWKLDVLVNNAGIMPFDPDYQKQLEEVFPVNTFAPLLVTEKFMPLLKNSKQPRIINVSSDLGSIGLLANELYHWKFAQAVTYRMSKAALNMLTVCLSHQLKEWNGKVWSFCPGYVVTNGLGRSEEQRQKMKENGAGDAMESGRGVLGIILGERDSDAGRFINKDAELPW